MSAFYPVKATIEFVYIAKKSLSMIQAPLLADYLGLLVPAADFQRPNTEMVCEVFLPGMYGKSQNQEVKMSILPLIPLAHPGRTWSQANQAQKLFEVWGHC